MSNKKKQPKRFRVNMKLANQHNKECVVTGLYDDDGRAKHPQDDIWEVSEKFYTCKLCSLTMPNN